MRRAGFAMAAGTLLVGVFMTLGAWAQHGDMKGMKGMKGMKMSQKGEPITVLGEVIDPVCYLRSGATGAEHRKCATACASQGVMLGILEKGTDNVYIVFPEGHGAPNTKLMPHVAKTVRAKGVLYSKGGLKALEVTEVAEVK